MAVTNEFMDAVQSGKTLRVRIMLKDSLLVDPAAVLFEEMEKYALGLMGDIYMEHDGERLDYDVSAWNENYLNQQMVSVVNNFSKERVELLKGMVRYLYKDRVETIKSEREDVPTHSGVTPKQVGTGVTVAGAAIAFAGICASQTALTIGGVVVAGAGVALLVSDKEKD
jgi:hypothetical protein